MNFGQAGLLSVNSCFPEAFMKLTSPLTFLISKFKRNMKTTIKQQIYAVRWALKAERENSFTLLYDRSATARQLKESDARVVKLNDAASTLAAVNMIGVEKIQGLPHLLEMVLALCEELNTPYNPGKTYKVIQLHDYIRFGVFDYRRKNEPKRKL